MNRRYQNIKFLVTGKCKQGDIYWKMYDVYA